MRGIAIPGAVLWTLVAAGCAHTPVRPPVPRAALRPPPMVTAPTLSPGAERFPLGTVFVTHHGGRTYFATDQTLFLRGPGVPPGLQARGPMPPDLPPPEASPYAVTFSPDGTRLLVQGMVGADVLRASDLRVLGSLHSGGGLSAWWEGERVGYMDNMNGVLHTGGRRRPMFVGQTELLAADPTGRYFFSMRQVRPGTAANEEVPTNALGLWRRTPGGRLRWVRRLAIDEFDGASVGVPCHLVVLDPEAVAFGEPTSGAMWYDSVCALCRGRFRKAPEQGDQLIIFGDQAPLVTKDSIIGLAVLWDLTGSRTARYLYRVTPEGLTLRHVPPDVVLVTYDPARGVGLGKADRWGVTVRYGVTDFGQRVVNEGRRG